MITLGHLSDLHASDPSDASWAELRNKRSLGWISWRFRRRKNYHPEVLDALIRDLHEQAPDHVAITGDLTNIALEKEFEVTARVLRKIGDPSFVSAIPGNHDAYIELPFERSWGLWSDYLASDADAVANPVSDWKQSENKLSNMFAYQASGPSLRIRGELALIGVSTAVPTPFFFARGEVGTPQLERLEDLLRELEEQGLCRVVLVHHPVLPQDDSFRRGMRDVNRFREVIQRAGAELVLHGHDHRTMVGELPAEAGGAIPVVGVRSSSYGGPSPDKSSHYHLYEVRRQEPEPGTIGPATYRISLRTRGWDPERRDFIEIGGPRPLGVAAFP